MMLWPSVVLGLLVASCGGDGPTQPDTVSLTDLFGTQLFDAEGTQVGVGSLEQNTLIGIYFMSPGCPACGAFSPTLVATYDEIKEDGHQFEIVMVVHGISPDDLFGHMVDESMGWLAVSPLSDHPNTLAQRYNVRWIPTVIIIEPDGTIVSMSGREQVAGQGANAWNTWMTAIGGS